MVSMDGLRFERWLEAAEVPPDGLAPKQREILLAAHHFLDECGHDYYSRRILGHFLMHAGTRLKVAQIARLVEVSRQTVSRRRKLSSKQVIQESHRRMLGKPYGKLLPRYAGPIIEFLVSHPQATRHDALDFIERTWNVRVSTVALSRFYKKFGLDRASRAEASDKGKQPAGHTSDLRVVIAEPPVPAGGAVPLPPDDFFLDTPPTVERSCSCPKPSAGSTSPETVSTTSTARCSADC